MYDAVGPILSFCFQPKKERIKNNNQFPARLPNKLSWSSIKYIHIKRVATSILVEIQWSLPLRSAMHKVIISDLPWGIRFHAFVSAWSIGVEFDGSSHMMVMTSSGRRVTMTEQGHWPITAGHPRVTQWSACSPWPRAVVLLWRRWMTFQGHGMTEEFPSGHRNIKSQHMIVLRARH